MSYSQVGSDERLLVQRLCNGERWTALKDRISYFVRVSYSECGILPCARPIQKISRDQKFGTQSVVLSGDSTSKRLHAGCG